jgi:hypothetical protein
MAVNRSGEGNTGKEANEHRPRYWNSRGQWIECDWDELLQRYICKEVNANEVPTTERDSGPG